MKLYFTKGACSLSIRICINELNLESEFESVDLAKKVTESGQNFLDINPVGAVPVLELDNGERLTENAAILQFLADTNNATNLLPAVGDFKRYRIVEKLSFFTTELHKGYSMMFNPDAPKEIIDGVVIPNLQAKFKRVDAMLEGNDFISGSEFTLPDCYLFVMLAWSKNFKLDLSECKNISGYFDRLLQHPSISKSLEQEGLSF